MHEKYLYDVDKEGQWLFEEDLEDDDDYDNAYYDDQWASAYEWGFISKHCGLGLKVALGNGQGTRGWRHFLTSFTTGAIRGDDVSHIGARGYLLPLSRFSDEEETASTKAEATQMLFHRDEDGKVTFTKQEAQAASTFIATMNLEERVKASKSRIERRCPNLLLNTQLL